MMKKIFSGILLTVVLIITLTLAFNTSFAEAFADPTISGVVMDKQGNPIPDVLIVAKDTLTGVEVDSATSNASGAYAMSVPPSTYNLIVTPPPESGFANTTIPNVEVTTDIAIDIVLVPAALVTFSGELLDRDGNPIPDQKVILSGDGIHEKEDLTDDQGLFSIQVPPGFYSLVLYAGGYATNVPSWFWLGKGINLTEDTFVTFILQNRYLTGKVIDPEGNPVANVSISDVSGSTAFDDFSGSFQSWTTSDSEGNFNVTVFTSPSVSLKATPPPESPYGPVMVTAIDLTEDTSITITLVQTVTFSGELLDRDGNPIPDQKVILSGDGIHEKEDLTDDQGLFSIQVPPGFYSLVLYAGGYATNVPSWFWLGKGINLTEDTFVTFILQNRYLTGKVIDPEGNPVANVSISDVSGSTAFDDFSGSFQSWTTSDSEGNFNVTVFTSPSVSLKATPPPESPYGPVMVTAIDVTEDKTVIICLVYKPGIPPVARFTWTPEIPEVGDLVTFDASGSTPNGGEIVRYEWDFGDGHNASDPIVTHVYTSPGTFTVTLNVTDSESLWDIEQKQIHVVPPPVISVYIDIKPQSCPNPFNMGSEGVLPVAILGTEDFDVMEVDSATVLLEGVAPLRWNFEDVSTPVQAGADTCECTTGGPDGYMDMTLKFDYQAVAAALGTVQDGETRVLTLTGMTYDSIPIQGEDCIRIIDKGKPRLTVETPNEFCLGNNYPNPFNPATTISFNLPNPASWTLNIYNVAGQLVRTFEGYSSGQMSVIWNGKDNSGNEVASGIYFYKLNADNFTATKKMVLTK
jgi:protocatechuate 3,4-dioxygenase beta subunit